MKKIYFLSFFLLTTVILTDSCTNKAKTETSTEKIITTQDNTESKNLQQGQLKNYVIDTENSVVEWIGRKTAGSHNGVIKLQKGILLKNKEHDIVSGKFMINMQSIECTDLTGGKKESIEGHLKDEDFFNTAKYPNASFMIKEVKDKKIIGMLTIKGISKAIEFEYTKLNDHQYEAEIIAMTAKMLGKTTRNSHESICGCLSSGGTESILLAMKAYRDRAREKTKEE